MSVPPVASYMLCTTPRCGSTLHCGLLSATGQAGHPDSHFHQPSIQRWEEAFGLPQGGPGTRRARLRTIFDAVRAEGTGNTGIFGLRMQQGSFDFFRRQLAVLHPEPVSDRARLDAAFGPMLFIHLTREDRLGQAISRLRAEQTGLWHRAPDGRPLERLSPPRPPRYDRDAIARHVAELEALDTGWRDWFRQEGVQPLTLRYEALARDPDRAVATVLSALGRDPDMAQGLRAPTAKLADGLSAAWAARFRAETAGDPRPGQP